MTTLSSTPQGGDFVVYQVDQRYALLSLPVENAGAAAVNLTQVAGYPVVIDSGQTKASLVEVGLTSYDEAQTNGFLVEGPKQLDLAAAAITAEKYAVLWAGPATLNENKIPAEDAAGNSFTLANIKTAALGNMEDIRFVTEPEIMSIQTADGNTAGP